MFGLAPRLDVQVRIVARYAHRLHGIVCVFRRQLLQLIEDLLADEVALLHPSHLSGCGPHLVKSAVVIENLDAVSVFYEASFFVDGRYAITEIDLHARNVGDFENASAAVFAGGERQYKQECEGRDTQPGWKGSFHGVNLSI